MCKINKKKKVNKIAINKTINNLKQKNNVSKKNSLSFFNRNKTIKKKKSIKKSRVIKKIFKLKLYNEKLFSFDNYEFFLNKIFRNKIVIRVKGNNFFCTFLRLKKNKHTQNQILQADSAGKYKLKASKKKIKFNLPIVLSTFIKRLERNKTLTSLFKKTFKKKKLFFDNLIIKVIAKRGLRRKIFNHLFYYTNGKNNRMFYLQPKKCFNGCRAVKARRKKRLRFRIFK